MVAVIACKPNHLVYDPMPDSRYPFSPARGWGSTRRPDSLGQIPGLPYNQKFPAGVVYAR